jgi:hypothetical protein
MSAYISWETAFQILATAYAASAVLLIAISYIGLAVLDTIEATSDRPTLPNWFT